MAKIVLTKSMGLKIEMKRFVMLGQCHFLELESAEPKLNYCGAF